MDIVWGDAWRLCTIYNLLQLLLIFVWFPVRLNASKSGFERLQNRDPFLGMTREISILGSVIVYLGKSSRRSGSIDAFFVEFWRVTKLTNVVYIAIADWRLAVWYVVLCAVAHTVVKPPRYAGPHKVATMSRVTLQELLFNERSTAVLVLFYTRRSQTCRTFEPTFARLSLKYASTKMKFGRVDLGTFTSIAEDYKIDTSVVSWQLPTLILFERGEEVRRLPPVDGKGNVVKTLIDFEGTAAYFKLAER